jgi:hypothetical protein
MNKRIIVALLFVASIFGADCWALDRPLKILHMSFHRGCLNDIDEVGRELGLDITRWFVQDDCPRTLYDGEERLTNSIYNVTHERAQKVWDINKEYFDQFDVIITSDTAPLSRIFVQNGWKKPLIIWICNRFDYADGETSHGRFPDREYYDLFRKAATMPNVRIVSYTPYEHVYARRRGVEIGTLTINPIGRLPIPFDESKSSIPKHIKKSDNLFLYPRMDGQYQVDFIQKSCAEVGLKTYHGQYNGPEDLTGFKGVLYFPYQWSNLALFENMQQGIVHFVPSESFIKQLVSQRKPVRHTTLSEFELCDWYAPEFRDHIVYFDSWEDLKYKVDTIKYGVLSIKVRAAGAAHRAEMLNRWQQVFDELSDQL